jgi:hypothetical protein
METELNNIVTALGQYNNIETTLSSETITTTMITGLTIELTANKNIWADGLLTYTITIKNETEKSYTSPTITDKLNISLITLLKDTIKIDDIKATEEQYNYEESTGTLTINLSDITASSTKKITFQVSKKT